MKKEITKLIEDSIDSELFFIVDLQVGLTKTLVRIKLVIDSNKGVNIDECGEISRKIYKQIDESGFVENYELEVTSPGVGEPLKLERQYLKNIGRLIKILDKNNLVFTGKLLDVKQGDSIIIEEQIKDKQKKATVKVTEIPFNDIKKAAIEVSFN